MTVGLTFRFLGTNCTALSNEGHRLTIELCDNSANGRRVVWRLVLRRVAAVGGVSGREHSPTVTSAILARLRELGYVVTDRRSADGTGIVLTARTVPPGPADVVAEVDGDDDEAHYRAACVLARGCGVDLEDG